MSEVESSEKMNAPLGKSIKVGISSCLLGEKVRYDGSHKRDDLIIERLSVHFELVPFCPEVAIGMGIPREPVQLVTRNDFSQPEARGVYRPDLDYTAALGSYADAISLKLESLSGYVFKSHSPSCGVSPISVYTYQGRPTDKTAMGIFAGRIIVAFPLLPVVEDGQINNPMGRDDFIRRVVDYSHRQIRL